MIGDRPNDLTVEERVRTLEYGVHDRLVALERANANLRRNVKLLSIGTGALLALVLLLFLAPGIIISGRTFTNLSARQLVLRDGDGLARGIWAVQKDGSARLVLNDDRGIARLRISVVKGGAPGVAFADSKAQPRVVLGMLPDETTNLVFADDDGSTRAVLGVSARDGSSNLLFVDQNGTTRAGLGMNSDGVGSLTLVDNSAPAAGTPADSAAGAAAAAAPPQTPPAPNP